MFAAAPGDRGIPHKRSYPMSGQPPRNPGFVQRQPFPNRQPYHSHQSPSMPSIWHRPRPSTFPAHHPGSTLSTHHPVSTIPPAHPTSVKSEAKAPIDFHNSPFPQQAPPAIPQAPSSLTTFPTLFESSTVSSQHNQFNDVTLDSLPSLGAEGTSQVLNDSILPEASAASGAPRLVEPVILPNSGDISNIDFLFQQHCSIENSDADKSLLSLLQDTNDPVFPTTNALVPPQPVMQNQSDPQILSNHQIMSPQQLPPQAASVPPQTMMSSDPMSPPQAANSRSPHPTIMSPGPGVMSPQQQVPNSVTPVFSPVGQPLATQQTEFYALDQGDHVDFRFASPAMSQARANSNNNNNFGDGREDSLDTFLNKFSN